MYRKFCEMSAGVIPTVYVICLNRSVTLDWGSLTTEREY